MPAGIIGGVAGAALALGGVLILEGTGAKDYVVDEVAEMYESWVTGEDRDNINWE